LGLLEAVDLGFRVKEFSHISLGKARNSAISLLSIVEFTLADHCIKSNMMACENVRKFYQNMKVQRRI